MEEYINGTLVKELTFYKKKENPYWSHKVGVTKFLWWKQSYDYWTYFTEIYSEEEMLKKISSESYIEDNKVYYYPHVVLKFSEEYKNKYYFITIEEAEEFIFKIINKYSNIFYKIK